MPERRAPSSLAGRLAAGAALAAVALVVVVALVVRSALGVSEAQRDATRSERLLAEAALTEGLAVDLETGLRGFVITGQPRFLEPYERARLAAPRAAARLRERADLPVQRRRAAAIEAAIQSYLRDYSRPLLAGQRPAVSREEATAVATDGKERLDALRAQIEALSMTERERLARRTAAADRRADRAILIGSLAFAALLGLLVALSLFVDRAILRPVRGMATAVDRLRAGDLSTRLDLSGPREIAGLGDAIDELAGSLADSRAQLEQSSAELRRLSDRNLLLLDTLFAQTPAALAFYDRELRYVRVNAALAAMTGHPVEAHIGRRVDEILPELGGAAVPVMQQVLATGEVVADSELSGTTDAAPGEERTFSMTYFPVREEGVVAGLGVVAVDVTDRKRAEAEGEAAYEAERRAREAAEAARARAAFLADAGAVLDSSLELEETMDAIAGLCVPRVADWCSFELAVPGVGLRNAAVAHVDPEKVAFARELQRRYPPDPTAPAGAAAVLRTGRAELYPEIPEELLVLGARDEEHLALIRALAMRSAMIVPLTARGQTFGAMTLVSAESARRFGDDDLALAQDLAVRAALALDNARLYRERSHVAQTLQASLLPEALPEIPGIRLAARYEPLGAGTEVGGDFYDVFAVADDRWAVVIGDVCGKGAEAAALTALARYTLRAVAPLAPRDALRRLNTAILRQRDDLRFITLVYGELDLSGGGARFTYASGGHPPGLLLHPGRAGEVLSCPGTLIGVTPEPPLGQCSVELGTGDTVALYTDGVTEASHAEPLDAEAIMATLGADRGAEAVADALVRLARSAPGAVRDDVAILALQVA